MGIEGRSLLSGMVAGIVATTVTNPIDVVRIRLQYKKSNDKDKYKSIFHAFTQIYKIDGLQGFIKGLAPRLIRKPLTNSCSFLLFETF